MRATAADSERQPIVGAASLELEDAEESELHAPPTLRRRLAWVPPLALLYCLDKLLALLTPLIHFPASLIGMATIVALLLAAESRRPALAVAAELWFRPGVVGAGGGRVQQAHACPGPPMHPLYAAASVPGLPAGLCAPLAATLVYTRHRVHPHRHPAALRWGIRWGEV